MATKYSERKQKAADRKFKAADKKRDKSAKLADKAHKGYTIAAKTGSKDVMKQADRYAVRAGKNLGKAKKREAKASVKIGQAMGGRNKRNKS